MRNRQHTEQRLIKSAIRQFARHGLHGVSVRSIAKEAEANLSLVSQYFGGKQPLYLRCIETIYTDLQQSLPEFSIRLEDNPRHAIRYAIDAAIRLGEDNRDALLLTMRHFIEHGQMDSIRRDTVLMPAIAHLSIQLAPYSELDSHALELSVFSAIMLIGRLVALSTEDLNTIVPFTENQGTFIDTTTTMICRMLSLEITDYTAETSSRRLAT